MPAPIFLAIIGTDTNVGKTLVTAALARSAAKIYEHVTVIKPVQTGCEPDNEGSLQSPDVQAYLDACPHCTGTALVTLKDECSPHMAAASEGVRLDEVALAEKLAEAVLSTPKGVILVEGSGGALTPVNEQATLLDVFVQAKELLEKSSGMKLGTAQSLLVIANRLGAINHALLSIAALRGSGLAPQGFILTTPVPNEPGNYLQSRIQDDNRAVIERMALIPCLGELPYIPELHSPEPAVRAKGLAQATDLIMPAALYLLGPRAMQTRAGDVQDMPDELDGDPSTLPTLAEALAADPSLVAALAQDPDLLSMMAENEDLSAILTHHPSLAQHLGHAAPTGPNGQAWDDDYDPAFTADLARAKATVVHTAHPPHMQPESIHTLISYDRDHIWHPYTSAITPLDAYPVEATEGTRIRLCGGRSLVDGMASWWCAIHGYNHPALVAAVKKQADAMPHVMFGGLTHAPAVRLAQKLVRMTGCLRTDQPEDGLAHVFFTDSGSVTVEVALKMAIQYHAATGNPGKTRLLTVRGGYHGDTLGAMSVCDPVTGMHTLFSDILPRQLFAPRPTSRFHELYNDADTAALENLLSENSADIAAVILEPIVQGAGGMWFYHPAYLTKVRELCDIHNCLLILDEIATGFGRTGKLFAAQWAGITPDIMCVGKALTGGMMTLAATLASQKVAHGISENGGVLMHGPTFMANPLACATACASLELLEQETWQFAVRRIEHYLTNGLEHCRALPGVADVRVLGAIGVVEMEREINVPKLQAWFVQHGVWLRPFGKLIYLMPPYVITDDELEMLIQAIFRGIKEQWWE